MMARTKTDSTRTNVYLPNTLKGAGEQLARHRGITFSELVRTALMVYIRTEVDRLKEQRDAQKARELQKESSSTRAQ